eukprot:TRINITY_DN11057_c0_g1_i1.p1 TRINITY_DN11057_c0_g1~~TRINITY_DN11057_c0_g1_i1.p1  ORF type:complete len:270 (-),score=70.11 TRINITY_DN11057_c0_g1_i1:107-916(-)
MFSPLSRLSCAFSARTGAFYRAPVMPCRSVSPVSVARPSYSLMSAPATSSFHSTTSSHAALRLGDAAPDFTVDSQLGSINLYEYLGDSWGILFSHPKDNTPVCTTELGEVAKLKSEFEKRNTKVIGLSVDSVESHESWIKDINDTQNTRVNFPLLADVDRTVSTLYDMIHPNADNTLTVRSVFIIGPDKKIKLTLTYPASTGRDFKEVLRVLDSLQLTAHYQVATPVNWRDGDDCVIVPSITNEQAKTKFPKGFTEIRPYLRMTPQPNK